MNASALNWLGWITQKPVTEDYAPLFLWVGVMWWGAAAGVVMLLSRPLPKSGRALAVLGRWSLSYYMVHQPVLIGALTGLAWLRA